MPYRVVVDIGGTFTDLVHEHEETVRRAHVDQLARALIEEGLTVPTITESNGGVMDACVAEKWAILTLFSGPVGGTVGSQAAGAGLGLANLIAVEPRARARRPSVAKSVA
jgi:N-methylhydantoinase A/oxoprolinase/acetone carboxylase beta subunit